MSNPRTLLLSIAATACGFVFTLVGVAGLAPTAGVAALGAAASPGLVSAVVQDASSIDPVTFAVARESDAISLAALDAADPDDGPDPLRGRARRP
jgi:hypothetical protein